MSNTCCTPAATLRPNAHRPRAGSGRARWRAPALLACAAFAAALIAAPAARAATCSADDFASAIDEAGARLRAFNAEASPKLQAGLKKLKARKGWTGEDADDKALDLIQDKKMQALDQQADELLVNIDSLGRPPETSPPDCAKLDELRAAGVELLAVMRAKSSHTLAKIDAELGEVSARTAVAPAPKPEPTPQLKPTLPAAKPAAVPPKSATLPPAPAPPAAPKSDAWSPVTETAARLDGPPAPIPSGVAEDGYSIDEIREATRGFFGTISTELASVIEHAFSKSGRPSAYILGQEGGGAFLAGLRYGQGTLYPRRGSAQPIYWNGPSVGYDFGAAGSRTLFLIYGPAEAHALHRRFAGIDGSAYLVGGVGVTYLRGGDIVLAPIRTGLGLRLGASIGYLRFTPRATWNPF